MRAVAVLVACLAVSLIGCNGPADRSPLADRVGQNCTVQFRRGDGLGAGGGLPVPPTTGGINGAEVSVGGKLRAVSGGWIVVESATAEYCIPRESILLVQFSK